MLFGAAVGEILLIISTTVFMISADVEDSIYCKYGRKLLLFVVCVCVPVTSCNRL